MKIGTKMGYKNNIRKILYNMNDKSKIRKNNMHIRKRTEIHILYAIFNNSLKYDINNKFYF
jgi:hypothetical protein